MTLKLNKSINTKDIFRLKEITFDGDYFYGKCEFNMSHFIGDTFPDGIEFDGIINIELLFPNEDNVKVVQYDTGLMSANALLDMDDVMIFVYCYLKKNKIKHSSDILIGNIFTDIFSVEINKFYEDLI